MTRAYSYRRWSTEQQGGERDSARRQLDKAVAYCLANNLVLDDSLKLIDEGVSAFKSRGKNKRAANLKETAKLALFKHAVEDGVVEPKSVLLCEQMDRLSREDPWTMMHTVKEICDLGITVTDMSDGQSYTSERFTKEPMMLFLLVAKGMTSHADSVKKSERVTAAWNARKVKAVEEGFLINEMQPGWIKKGKVAKGVVITKAELIPEHVATVRRIIDEFLAGSGTWKICKGLNRDNVPRFGKGKKWFDEGVRRVVDNEACHGMYNGNPSYFPPVCTMEEFNDMRALRSTAHKPKSKSAPLINPLSAVATCVLCDGLLSRMIKHGRSRLVCLKWKTGKVSHPYYGLDMNKAIDRALNQLPHMLSEQPVGDVHMVSAFDDELFRINADIVAVQGQIDRLMDLFTEGVAKDSMKTRITSLEADKKILGAELAKCAEEAAIYAPASIKRHRKDLLEVVLAIPYGTDDHRDLSAVDITNLNTKLRMVVKSITFSRDGLIKDWTFVGQPHGTIDDVTEIATAMTKARQGIG